MKLLKGDVLEGSPGEVPEGRPLEVAAKAFGGLTTRELMDDMAPQDVDRLQVSAEPATGEGDFADRAPNALDTAARNFSSGRFNASGGIYW